MTRGCSAVEQDTFLQIALVRCRVEQERDPTQLSTKLSRDRASHLAHVHFGIRQCRLGLQHSGPVFNFFLRPGTRAHYFFRWSVAQETSLE